jgi:hypothetical protein
MKSADIFLSLVEYSGGREGVALERSGVRTIKDDERRGD